MTLWLRAAGSQILVEQSVYTEFIEALTAAAEAWQPTEPLDPRTSYGGDY